MTKVMKDDQDFINKQLDEATYRQKAFDDRFDNQKMVDEIREIVNEYLQIEMCQVGKTLISDLLTVLEFSTKGNSG